MELDFSEQIRSNASLWENIRKKKERIKRGSPERMRKPGENTQTCLLYTSPSPRDGLLSRMPSSA